jgi:TonB family protein
MKHQSASNVHVLIFMCLAAVVLIAAVEVRAGTIASKIPTAVKTILPAVPNDLADRTVERSLELWFWVTDTGAVRWANVVDSPDERLSALVEKAAHSWTFRPAFHDGKTSGVMCGTTVTVRRGQFEVGELKLHEEIDQQPKVIEAVPPRYPLSLSRTGIEGRVVVQFVVDESGKVINPLVSSSTNRGFDEPALESIRNWKFTPAIYRGRPVASVFEQPITFALHGRGATSRFEIRSKGDRSVPDEFRFDSAATVLLNVPVVYPWNLAIAGEKGSAEVKFVIGRNG